MAVKPDLHLVRYGRCPSCGRTAFLWAPVTPGENQALPALCTRERGNRRTPGQDERATAWISRSTRARSFP